MSGLRRTRNSKVQKKRALTKNLKNCSARTVRGGNGRMEEDAQSSKPFILGRKMYTKPKLEAVGYSLSQKPWLSVEKKQHITEWISKHSMICPQPKASRMVDFGPVLGLDAASSTSKKKFDDEPWINKIHSVSNIKSPILGGNIPECSERDIRERQHPRRRCTQRQCSQPQRPQRRRPPHKLEHWKPFMDKEGNLKLQGRLVLSGDMVAGQLLITNPVEIWECGGVVRTRDKKTYQLVGEMLDPYGDVPYSVKEIIQKGGAVDWRRLKNLMHERRNYQKDSVRRSRRGISTPSNKSIKVLSPERRGKKRSWEDVNPSQRVGKQFEKISSPPKPVKRRRGEALDFPSPPAALEKRQPVRRKSPTRRAAQPLNSSDSTDKKATIPKTSAKENASSICTQRYCVKESSIILQSSTKTRSGKNDGSMCMFKCRVPSNIPTASRASVSLKMLDNELVGKEGSVRRSDRFLKQRSCSCCCDGDSAKHTAVENSIEGNIRTQKSNQLAETSDRKLRNECVRRSQIRKTKVSKVTKAVGRPLTRSLTTRAMRSLLKPTESSDFTSPKRTPPWLWKSSSPTPQKRAYCPKQAVKLKEVHVPQKKGNPSKDLNHVTQRTQDDTTSVSVKKTKCRADNQKSKGSKAEFLDKRPKTGVQSEEVPHTKEKVLGHKNSIKKMEEEKDLKSFHKMNARVKKDNNLKETPKVEDGKFCCTIKKPEKNSSKRSKNSKKDKNCSNSKDAAKKNSREMESNLRKRKPNSSVPLVNCAASERSHDSVSSCGPSASVIFSMRRIQEMKAPRTLRERQLQDAKIDQMQQKVLAAQEDDPLANLDLQFRGVTNEQCDYNQLLTSRRYSKSDSCCTPPACYILEEEENDEDAASSVATPSLLSWKPERKAVQSYMQRQRGWNSGRRPKDPSSNPDASLRPVGAVVSSMDYSVVRTKENDCVSCVSSFFGDQEDSDE